jgi:hypothetical protein
MIGSLSPFGRRQNTGIVTMTSSTGDSGMERAKSGSADDGREDEEKKSEDEEDDASKKKETFRASCRHCFCNLKGTFPRLYAIVFRVVVPLWVLIFISAVCGYFLANMEAPAEFDQNDFYLSRQIIETSKLREELEVAFNLPLRCYDMYLESRGYPNANNEVVEELYGPPYLDATGSLFAGREDPDFTNETNYVNLNATGLGHHQNSSRIDNWYINDTIMDRVENHVNGTRDFMVTCGEDAGEIAVELYDVSLAIDTVVSYNRLTFTWIRCWDADVYGDMLWAFTPTEEQLAALHDQSRFYEDLWTEMQQDLFENFLKEYPDTPLGRLQAFNRSITDATGRHGCQTNVGGTAWFWFTVMSTVGKFKDIESKLHCVV